MSDLLDELSAENDAEVTDLLSGMDDAGAPAWVPEEAGEGVQGTLTDIDFQDDEYETDPVKAKNAVPIWTIKQTDGEAVRAIGFSSVLRREMIKKAPEVGDLVAVKYFGTRELTKGKNAGKPYKMFRVAARKNS